MLVRTLFVLALALAPLSALAQAAHVPLKEPAALLTAGPGIDSLSVMSHVAQRLVLPDPPEIRRHRNDAMLNGALIALGALGIFDNVVVHWILELHRAVPGEHALAVEIGIVVVSAAMLGYGLWRERRARQTGPG
jgi:hypothetical protein